MWELRKIYKKRIQTLRVLFLDGNKANWALDEVVEWIDQMGITLLETHVDDLDYNDGYVLVVRFFGTMQMSSLVCKKMLEIKSKYEGTEA